VKQNNLIQEKSFEFSLKIIQICKDLKISREYELSRQLLKSGTSIGANVEEALVNWRSRTFSAYQTSYAN
jgi:four helix bundle protein